MILWHPSHNLSSRFNSLELLEDTEPSVTKQKGPYPELRFLQLLQGFLEERVTSKRIDSPRHNPQSRPILQPKQAKFHLHHRCFLRN
jgi:hypothetical protein